MMATWWVERSCQGFLLNRGGEASHAPARRPCPAGDKQCEQGQQETRLTDHEGNPVRCCHAPPPEPNSGGAHGSQVPWRLPVQPGGREGGGLSASPGTRWDAYPTICPSFQCAPCRDWARSQGRPTRNSRPCSSRWVRVSEGGGVLAGRSGRRRAGAVERARRRAVRGPGLPLECLPAITAPGPRLRLLQRTSAS